MLLTPLIVALLTREAGATPRTREVYDAQLRAELSAAPWDEAERALRLAIAREMVHTATPGTGWQASAEALELSRVSGAWQTRWQLRAYEEALVLGDATAARDALYAINHSNPELAEQRAWELDLLEISWFLKQAAPWIFGAVAAAGIGVWLDALSLRRRRDNRERFLVNPFVTGRPLRDARLVYGREGVLRSLLADIAAKRSVYLTGERRIGKTTLLLQVGEMHQRGGGQTVLVDVAGTSGDGATRALQRALGGAARLAGLPHVGEPLALAKALAARAPVLLLVDEVDALNGADRPTRALFRALTLDPGAPTVMVAAGVGLNLDSDDEARSWSDRIRVLPIGPLPDPDARRLLVEPLSDSLAWRPKALDAVLSEARGRPMLLQLYGMILVERLSASGESRISPADVEAATPEVEKAWRTIADQGLAEEGVAVDVDTAQLELGRLCQEIEELNRQVELLR